MIRFAGQMSEAEFRRAQWLSSPRWTRWFGWVILAGLVVLTTTGGWHALLENPASQLPNFAIMLVLGIFAVVAPRRAIRRVWLRTPLLHEPVTGELSESAVVWQTPSTNSSFSWDKIVRRQVAPDMILLYTSERQALIIPQRYFATTEEWRAASELVSRLNAA